jgi:hypothetical protein
MASDAAVLGLSGGTVFLGLLFIAYMETRKNPDPGKSGWAQAIWIVLKVLVITGTLLIVLEILLER